MHLQSGEVDKAIDALKQGMKRIPMNPNLPLFLANIQLQLKRYSEAEKTLAAAENLAPTHPAVLGVKGNLQLMAGRKDDARASLTSSVTYNYNDFDSWDNLQEINGKRTFESLAPMPAMDSLLQAASQWEGLKRQLGGSRLPIAGCLPPTPPSRTWSIPPSRIGARSRTGTRTSPRTSPTLRPTCASWRTPSSAGRPPTRRS